MGSYLDLFLYKHHRIVKTGLPWYATNTVGMSETGFNQV